MGYPLDVMPKKVEPSSEFGRRLHALRSERGLTQIELAEAIGSSQRAISYYETVAEFPPAAVIIDLAKALGVSTDELLGVKNGGKAPKESHEARRLRRQLQQVLALPEKDRRAIVRMINSLVGAQTRV